MAVAVVAALAVFVAACGGGATSTSSEGGTVKVGFIAPLSGSIAQLGTETQHAAQLAVDTVNKKGGIDVNGKKWKVELVSEDEGSSSVELGVAGMERLAAQDGVVGVVGGVISSSVLAYMPIPQRSKLPFVDIIGKADTIPQAVASKNLDYVWVLSPGTPDIASTHTDLWLNLVKPKKISFMQVDTDAARAEQKNFEQAFADKHLDVQTQWLYAQPTVTDFGPYILKIKDFKPDAIYVNLVGTPTYSWARQLAQSGYSGFVLTGDSEYASSSFVTTIGKDANLDLVNADTYPAPVTPLSLPFYNDFKASYNVNVAAYYDVQGYDGMLSLFEGMKRSGGLTGDVTHDRQAIENGLKKIDKSHPYQGVRSATEYFGGISSGHKMPTSLVVTQIQDGKTVPVWPLNVAKAANSKFIDPRK